MTKGENASKAGEFAKAVGFYQLALNEAQKLGKENELVLHSLNNLACAERRLEKMDNAEAHFKLAVEIANSGKFSDQLKALALSNLGGLYSDTQPGKSEPLLTPLEMYRKIYGDQSKQGADALGALANAKQNLGLIQDAETLNKQVLGWLFLRLNSRTPEDTV